MSTCEKNVGGGAGDGHRRVVQRTRHVHRGLSAELHHDAPRLLQAHDLQDTPQTPPRLPPAFNALHRLHPPVADGMRGTRDDPFYSDDRLERFGEFDVIGPDRFDVANVKIGENAADPLKMYLVDIMSVAANLVGVPSISVPAGTSNGLPVGLQIMAPQRADRELLGFSKAAEGLL